MPNWRKPYTTPYIHLDRDFAMKWNIPILLTWLRVWLIPVFTVLFYLPDSWLSEESVNWWAAIIFTVAAVTDWLDGYLARKWNQTSSFGAFLDPVADKLMVAVALILLVSLDRTFALFAMIIIGREITISALREWMAQLGRRNNVAVAQIGKFKTAAQMAAIVMLLVGSEDFFGMDLIFFGNILMAIAVILTVWSMCYYLKVAFADYKE